MTTLRIDVTGLDTAATGLRQFAATVTDLRPFWRLLGETLADTSQARWPLSRRSGRLRRSLTWAGDKLGRGGVYQADPDRLTFGTGVFYSRFTQTGTKRQRARPLIHVDDQAHTAQLVGWLQARAATAGGRT